MRTIEGLIMIYDYCQYKFAAVVGGKRNVYIKLIRPFLKNVRSKKSKMFLPLLFWRKKKRLTLTSTSLFEVRQDLNMICIRLVK